MTALVASFFGGAFLSNALAHLGVGVLRRPFPTPFAKPPFRGLSPPAVNLAWGAVNLAAAGALLRLGGFDGRDGGHLGALVAGVVLMALQLVRSTRAAARERARRE